MNCFDYNIRVLKEITIRKTGGVSRELKGVCNPVHNAIDRQEILLRCYTTQHV